MNLPFIFNPIEFSKNHAKKTIILLLIITGFFSYYLNDVEVYTSVKKFKVENDPENIKRDKVTELFGSDNFTIIYIEDRNLFTPSKLELAQAIHYELENIEGINRVQSLFNVSNFKDIDGSLHTTPLLSEIPESMELAKAIREEAIANPLFKDVLISSNKSALAFTLTLDHLSDDPKFNIKTSKQIQKVINNYNSHFERFFQAGTANIEETMAKDLMKDMQYLIPLACLVVITILFIGLGSINAAIIPIM